MGNSQPQQKRGRHRHRNGNHPGAALSKKTPILCFCIIHLGNLQHREYGRFEYLCVRCRSDGTCPPSAVAGGAENGYQSCSNE